MQIDWVNHASFVASVCGVRLMADPWLEGRVFNKSWAHVADTRFGAQDFADVSHIWFSHEHPDHFSPADLKRIPPATRSRIEILFQNTVDKKVVHYCQGLGFARTTELRPGAWHELSPGVRVQVGTCANMVDSWLCLQSPEGRLLNLNDCALECAELERVATAVGTVDVLFTQFSYASAEGGPADRKRRERAAREKLEEMRLQIAVLQPAFVVPYASFVWFCHEDNFHMNDAANSPATALKYLESLGARPILLYPGESWTLSAPHDSRAVAEKYAADMSARLEGPALTPSGSVELRVLAESAQAFLTRSLAHNGRSKLRSLRPFRAALKDHHGQTIAFSFRDGFNQELLDAERCDIVTSSQALDYCFRHTWGFDTLLVSGIFETPSRGDFSRFLEYQGVAHLNNHGGRLDTVVARNARRLAGWVRGA